jgi:hypothetical protein
MMLTESVLTHMVYLLIGDVELVDVFCSPAMRVDFLFEKWAVESSIQRMMSTPCSFSPSPVDTASGRVEAELG